MKIVGIIIIILLTFGCSKKQTDLRIAQFEKILGKENSETLTLMVAEFEDGFLKNKYPNLKSEQAYERLLTEMRESKSQSWNKLPKFDKSRFEKSELKYEIYAYVDSVWIEEKENPMMVSRYKLLDNGTFYHRSTLTSYRPKDEVDKDTLMKNRYTWTDLNYQSGRFWEALRKTGQKDKFIVDYLDFANSSGVMQPEIMVDKMLNTNMNYSDYFIKRIIVTELSYQ